MKIIIFLFIYLSGCVYGYFLERRHVKKIFGEWTVTDRLHALIGALFSWVFVIATYFNDFELLYKDKPAKW